MNDRAVASEIGTEVQKASGWYIFFGVILLLGGIVAVARPLHAGMALTLIIGWVLVLSGVMGGVNALIARSAGGFVWRLILAALYILGGVYVLQNPATGLASLTIVLGAVLFFGGIMKLLLASALTGIPGVGLLMASGIVSMILGVVIWAKLPESSEVVVGTVIGLDFIMSGISMVMFAIGVRGVGDTLKN